jgi:hypothetical protein
MSNGISKSGDAEVIAAAVEDIIRKGIHVFGTVIDPSETDAIYSKARELRTFGPNLFLTEEEYLANPQHFGVNPQDGRNFIENFAEELKCIEQNPVVLSTLCAMLGDGYRIHNKKFVCGIPYAWIPAYLQRKMEATSINNLGAFIRPEFRDITYFHGIDFHQDIIDWPAWTPDKKTQEILTLYVYIHDVGETDAPLFALPCTHKFGATAFPHEVTVADVANKTWLYKDPSTGREMTSQHVVLTGQSGYAAIWHSCLLHGTQNIARSEQHRLSLRYILQRSDNRAEAARIDELNAGIEGPLCLHTARVDLDADGKVILQANSIRQTAM